MVRGEELGRARARADARPKRAAASASYGQNRFFHPDTSATSQLLTDLLDALDTRFRHHGAHRPPRLSQHRRRPARARVAPGLRWAGCAIPAAAASRCGARAGLRELHGQRFPHATRAAPGQASDPRQDRSAADLGHRLAGRAPHRRPPWSTGQDLFPENAAAMGLRPARGASGAPPCGRCATSRPGRRDERRALTRLGSAPSPPATCRVPALR